MESRPGVNSDYILTQQADKALRYRQLPPEADGYRPVAGGINERSDVGSHYACVGRARIECGTRRHDAPIRSAVVEKIAALGGVETGLTWSTVVEFRVELILEGQRWVPSRMKRCIRSRKCPLPHGMVVRYDPPFDLSGPSEGRHSPDTRRASQAGTPVGENPKRGGDSVPEEEYDMTGRYD